MLLNYHTNAHAKSDRAKAKAERAKLVQPVKVYKGLNTAAGYNAAPKHIRECWDRCKA